MKNIASSLIVVAISMICINAHADDSADEKCAAAVKNIIDGYETGYSLNKTEENKGILDAAKKVQKYMEPCPAKEHLLSFSTQSVNAAAEKASSRTVNKPQRDDRN